MKKQNLDFEVAQDIFIELKHYAIGFIIHELQNRVTKSIYALWRQKPSCSRWEKFNFRVSNSKKIKKIKFYCH